MIFALSPPCGEPGKRASVFPKDLSVIGVDNILLSDYTCPSLTTISQPLWEIGLQSVEMLLDRVLQKTKGGPKEKTLPSKLILRESTGHAPEI
jgi:LacI family transcriptional regulator